MKRFLPVFTVCILQGHLLLAVTGSDTDSAIPTAEAPAVQLYDGETGPVFAPGTNGVVFPEGYEDPVFNNVLKGKLPSNEDSKEMDGNSVINTSYTVSGCGINYTQGSVVLLRRFTGTTPPSGQIQPAPINISGIPPCATIVKAFLYADASGNGIAINATLRNPTGTAATFPMTIIGSDVDKCWGSAGYARVYSYRADVTSIINGNGTYQVSGLPVGATNDVDGATLIIVYQDPNQLNTGTIVLGDGANVSTGGVTLVDNLGGFTACAASTTARAFMVIADLQAVGNSALVLNSTPFTQSFANDLWWNFIEVPTSVAAGQSTSRFTSYNAGDCYNVVVCGLYFQSNCLTCVRPTLNVNVTPSLVCTPTSATATATGGTAPYTYTWSNGMTGQTISGVPAGPYTVNVVDSRGCVTGTGSVTIPPYTIPNVVVNSPAICDGTSATLTATGASTYTWTGGLGSGSTVTTPVLNAPATYTVTGTDVNGCTNTAIATVTVNPNPTVSVNSPTICGGNTTTLNASGASTYTWTGGLPNGATVTTPVLTATTSYTVTGTDANGCTDTEIATVTVNAQPAVTVNSPAICEGNATTLNASGADSYTWTGGLPPDPSVTTPVLTSTTAYTVTGTGSNGCTNTAIATVTVNPLPTVTVNSPSICDGTSATLNAGGASTYTWTGGLPNGATVTTPVLNSNASYTVTGTDANGCVNSATSNVTVNPNPTVNVNSPTICAGNTTTLNAGGASTYTWTGGLPNGATVTTPVLNSTISYTVTGTDANGCTDTDIATVTVNPTPTVSVNSPDICTGFTASLSASGASTYTWTGGLPATATVTTPVLTSTTSYTVTGTAPNGCTNTATATVTVNPLPAVTVNSPTICAGNTTTLNAGGASTYTWTGSLPSSATVTTPILNSNTSYTVTGTDVNGCVNTATSNVTVNPNPTVSVNSPTICAGNTSTLNANGASTYTWTGGLPNGATVTTPVLNSSATYTVTGTDGNGCTGTAISNVTVNPNPTVSVNSPAICNGQTASLTASGASTYTWTGGLPASATVTTPVLSSTTSYTVTGTAPNGCTNSAIATVTVNPLPAVTVNSPTICAGNSTTLTAGGASTYTWTGGLPSGATVNTPILNSTTSYTVTGTDGNGCVNTATSNVTVNPNPTVSVNSPTVCAGESATLTAGGASTYTWTGGLPNGATVTTPILNASTSYTVTGTDGNGCTNTATSNVTVTASPNVTVNSESICTGESTVLTATGADTYSWSNGASGSSITVSPSATTTYSVTGLLTGCSVSASASATVTVNPLPGVSVTSSTICAGNSTTLTASGASTYSWTGGLPSGSTVTTPVLNSSTSYTVTGTDANGCVNTAIANVSVNPLPSVTVNSPAICSGQTANLNAGGASTYTWTGGLPAAASVSTPVLSSTTSYTVTGTDGNGCINTATSTVTVNPLPNVTVTSPAICTGFSTTLTASGANTYTWTGGLPNGATVNTPVLTSTTSYTVTGTDGNNCSNTAASTVTVNPLPSVIVNSPTICAGSTATLNAGGASTYTWSGGLSGGGSVSTPVLNANTSYTVTGTDANNCKNTATALVTVNPVKSTNLRQTICQGQSVTVGGQTFPSSGVYSVALQTSLGCDSIVNLDLTVKPNLVVEVNVTPSQNDICEGSPVTFTAAPVNGGATPRYQWFLNNDSVGVNSPVYTNLDLVNGDKVMVQLLSSEQCTQVNPAFSSEILMDVNSIDYTIPSVTLCAGDDFLVDLSIPQPNYIIDWTNGTDVQSTVNSDELQISNTASGSIAFTVRFGNGCSESDVIPVTVNPLPLIDASVDRNLVRYQEEVQLNVAGAGTLAYVWTPAEPLSSPTISNPTAIITAPTLFQVDATDVNGCKRADTVFVDMIDECSDNYIFIPNSFTPNLDGLNDCFGVLYTPVMSEFKLVIFDRWGEKMFETTDVNACWDGTYKGVDALMDTYPYVVGFRCYDGKFIQKKGILTLVR